MSISISAYSIFESAVVFNFGVIVMSLLRKRTLYLQKFEVESLILLFALSVVRLTLPLDIKHAIIFKSDFLIPKIETLLKRPIMEGINVGSLLLGVWVVGIVIKCVYTIITSYKTISEVKNYIKIESFQVNRFLELPQYKKVFITVTPNVSTPIATGILCPHIFLPVLDITDVELEMILKHEIQHIKNKDIIIKCIFSIFEAVFWWNPFFGIFGKELENVLELYCDKGVTSKMSKMQRETYCLTLIKVVKQSVRKNPEYGLVVTGFSKAEQVQIVKQRIEVILGRNKKKISLRKTLLNISFVFVFLLSYFIIIQPHYDLSTQDAYEIIKVTSESAYIERDADGIYMLIINGKEAHELSELDMKIEPYYSLSIIEK